MVLIHSKTTFVTVNLNILRIKINSCKRIQKQRLLLLISLLLFQNAAANYIQKQRLLLLIYSSGSFVLNHANIQKQRLLLLIWIFCLRYGTFYRIQKQRLLLLIFSVAMFSPVEPTLFKNNVCYC